MTKHGGINAFESPDGTSIYYTKRYGETSLWKVPVEGGEEKQVLEFLSGYGNFAVVDEGIYFIPKLDPETGASIQFFSFSTGTRRLIAAIGKPGWGDVAVSPDGRSILYTQRDHVGADLMLVENFR